MPIDIENLKQNFYDNFPTCISNFNKCSYDDANNVYLVSSLKECLNFDLVKNEILPGKQNFHSVDSLAFDKMNKKILFIEFKNSEYKKCKSNFIESSKDSFLIYRLIVSLIEKGTINCVKRKCIFVLDESKNSSTIASYNACKRSNKLEENTLYTYLKRELIDNKIFGNSYFDEIELCTQRNFDSIVSDI